MADVADCQDFFTQNSDISGIGVRVGFYMEILILIIQTIVKSDEVPVDAFWTLTCMSLGLLIAAAVSAAQGQLSFFNAVQVENLVWFANFCLIVVYSVFIMNSSGATQSPSSTIYRSPPHVRRRHRDRLSDAFFLLNFMAAASLTFYLWGRGQLFGPQPECIPLLKFYFYFWKVSLSFNFIRVVMIVWYCLATLICFSLVFKISPVVHVYGVFSLRLSKMVGQPDQRPWGKTSLLPDAVTHRLSQFSVLIGYPLFYIPSLELFLKQGAPVGSAAAQWTFGQILSLTAAVPLLISLIFAIVDKIKQRKEESSTEEQSIASMPSTQELPTVSNGRPSDRKMQASRVVERRSRI